MDPRIVGGGTTRGLFDFCHRLEPAPCPSFPSSSFAAPVRTPQVPKAAITAKPENIR